MLDPTTETKRGNFGRYYPWSRALVLHAWVGHGTMGLKCVNLPPMLIISTLMSGQRVLRRPLTHQRCRPLLGGYYQLHKPLLGILAVLKVHHHNSQKYQIPTFLLYNPMVHKNNQNQSNNHRFFFETWQFFQGVDISRIGGSPDLKCFKTQAVFCKNQICPGHC